MSLFSAPFSVFPFSGFCYLYHVLVRKSQIIAVINFYDFPTATRDFYATLIALQM